MRLTIKYINEIGFDYIQQKEEKLTKIAINGLKGHKYIHILGSDDYKNHTGIAKIYNRWGSPTRCKRDIIF